MTNKTNKKVALGSVLVALSVVPAQLANADTAGLNVEANIVASPIVITAPQSLDFGGILEAGGGLVTVPPVGAATYDPGVSGVGLPPSPGLLHIAGNAGPNIILSVTTSQIAVSNGTDTMIVNNFNLRTAAGGTVETFALTATNVSIPIGATLDVGAGQNVGTYQGAVTVDVQYQ